MKKFLIVVLVAHSCLAFAQSKAKYPEQTMGVGLLLGAGNFNEIYPVSFGYGLKADYQRNLAPWFSLRFETAYTRNTASLFVGTLDQFGEYSENYSKPSALSLGVSPLLYGRFKSLDFFVGASVAGAMVWHAQELYLFQYDSNNQLASTTIDIPTNNELSFGLNPIAGFNFSLGGRRNPKAELELAFSMHRWRNSLSEEKNYVNYNFYNLQLTYRFILK